jgi:hypothetical protein
VQFSLPYIRLINSTQERLPHLLCDFKLHGVITSCDSFDIPFNILIFENASQIVYEYNKEEGDENSDATYEEALSLSLN